MPTTQFAFKEKYRYQNGFNSYHEYGIQTSQLYVALTSRQKRGSRRRSPHRSKLTAKASTRPVRRKALWNRLYSTTT
jgi:hypothetical protein